MRETDVKHGTEKRDWRGLGVAGALVVLLLAFVLPTASNGAASDTSKGQMVTCSVDSGSGCTVEHGLGVKPSSVTGTVGGRGQLLSIPTDQVTDTSFRANFNWHDGTTFLEGTGFTFYVHYDLGDVTTPTPTPSTPPVSTPPVSTPPTSTTPPVSTPPTTPASGPFSVRVAGNKLIDGDGDTLLLRGVNRSGTQYVCQEGDGIFDGPSDNASITAMKSWGINVVRVNGNEACALGINGVPAAYGGANYVNALKDYINRLHAQGIYVILDLHHNGPGTQQSTDNFPMADRDHSPAYWTLMANTFKNDPAVVFDLYNEPWPQNGGNSNANWACIRDGGSGASTATTSACRGQGFSYVAAGMQEMLNAVRATGATNVIMVGGTNWAGYLDKWTTYKPTDLLNQLAASVHVYANPLGSPYASPSTWNGDIATLALTTPVIAGEGMDSNCTHTTSDQWFPWAESKGVSYVFWAWIPGQCGNEPSLITNYNGTPTAYGIGLRNWLLAHPLP